MFKKNYFVNVVLLISFIIITGSGCLADNNKITEKENKIQGFDMKNLIREHTSGKNVIKLNLTPQILKLDIPEEKEEGFSEGISQIETPIYPTLDKADPRYDFVSASILSAKAKQFDDGLYAAVELAAQDGSSQNAGKKKMLLNIYNALKDLEDPGLSASSINYSRGFILAAVNLGGNKINGNEIINRKAEEITKEFLGNELRSKPIGFYTWNTSLEEIFKEDRLLQENIKEKDTAIALAKGIINSKEVESYTNYLNFVSKLTNALVGKDLRGIINDISSGRDPAFEKNSKFFPPSRAYETDLVKKLFAQAPIPDDFNLADKLIEEIKNGKIDLTPKKNSGWYDYQTFSLESLIIPEKFPECKKLIFTDNYKKELIELFKSILAITRETHIKQLEIPICGNAPPNEDPEVIKLEIYPEISVEPLATYYLRRARAYNFIHGVLKDYFGEETLTKMFRLTSAGVVKKNLEQELKDMEALFFGLALQVCYETGCELDITADDGSGEGAEKDLLYARKWLSEAYLDPDISTDSRMMVPVFYDTGRQKTKVWAFLGYEKKKLTIEFSKMPDITVFNENGEELPPKSLQVSFFDTAKELLYPVFAEIYVKKILNRDEFRKLCDKYKTRNEIIKALENI